MTKDTTNQPPLTGLAQRLQTDPRFMAYALAAYQRQEGMADEELAPALGMLPELVMRLALCRRPDPHSPQFAEQVREIADYALADEGRLANLLRQISSLEKLAQRQPTPATANEEDAAPLTAGFLAAARDRNETEEDQPQPAEDQAKPEAQ